MRPGWLSECMVLSLWRELYEGHGGRGGQETTADE